MCVSAYPTVGFIESDITEYVKNHMRCNRVDFNKTCCDNTRPQDIRNHLRAAVVQCNKDTAQHR